MKFLLDLVNQQQLDRVKQNQAYTHKQMIPLLGVVLDFGGGYHRNPLIVLTAYVNLTAIFGVIQKSRCDFFLS